MYLLFLRKLTHLCFHLQLRQISPITSAQILATFDAFFINFKDVFAPLAFLVAFAWKSPSSATVTATPIISKMIPTKITVINIIIDTYIFNFSIPLFDINETMPDNTNVKKNASIGHFKFDSLFFSCNFLVSIN